MKDTTIYTIKRKKNLFELCESYINEDDEFIKGMLEVAMLHQILEKNSRILESEEQI